MVGPDVVYDNGQGLSARMTGPVCYKPFGWQGIEAEVPSTWELNAYNGDAQSGYAALDDGPALRLQVRWNRRVPRRPDLAGTLRRYARSIEKKAKRSVDFRELGLEFLPHRCQKERRALPFRWEGAHTVLGMSWHCPTCPCLGMVELLFPRDGADLKLARHVLASATDHRQDGQRLWAVYDFAFLAPAAYNLAESDLKPGRLAFSLEAPKRGLLKVLRWSMADEWLKKAPLDQWPRKLVGGLPAPPPSPLAQEAITVRDHRGWRFRQEAARRRLRRCGPVEGCVWRRCEDDRIYAVLAVDAEEGLVDAVAATMD